jgi:hypothetical protein
MFRKGCAKETVAFEQMSWLTGQIYEDVRMEMSVV